MSLFEIITVVGVYFILLSVFLTNIKIPFWILIFIGTTLFFIGFVGQIAIYI